MRDAAMAIRDLVGDRSAEQVEVDALGHSALLWHFTVLGESRQPDPPGTKDSHPRIAWPAATRLRNRIATATQRDTGRAAVTQLDDRCPRHSRQQRSSPIKDVPLECRIVLELTQVGGHEGNFQAGSTS
jgi:uncharacterized protein with HEPN domain